MPIAITTPIARTKPATPLEAIEMSIELWEHIGNSALQGRIAKEYSAEALGMSDFLHHCPLCEYTSEPYSVNHSANCSKCPVFPADQAPTSTSPASETLLPPITLGGRIPLAKTPVHSSACSKPSGTIVEPQGN